MGTQEKKATKKHKRRKPSTVARGGLAYTNVYRRSFYGSSKGGQLLKWLKVERLPVEIIGVFHTRGSLTVLYCAK